MFKKIMKGILVGGALLALTVPAQATDYDINIYGASAQHKFWLNLAPDYLANDAGCTTVNQYSYNKKHGMAVGENCAKPAAGDKITIRYSSRASYDGIVAVAAGATRSMCNAADDCASLTATVVNLGASDVAGLSFQTSTQGWEDGNQSYPGSIYYANAGTLGWPDAATMATLDEFNPIVVPFGFLINNDVTEYRCAAPVSPDAGNDKAYDKFGWSCVPDSNYACTDGVSTTREDCEELGYAWNLVATSTPADADGVSADCVGFYKCLGFVAGGCSETGSCEIGGNVWPGSTVPETTCTNNGGIWTAASTQPLCEAITGAVWNAETLGTCNGGLNANDPCDEADDCPDVAVADTLCKEVPVNNITQAMARQIFSGAVSNWSDFGPSYTDVDIVRCMRHSGSGTHATMNLAVMDGVSMISNSSANETWHFTSSSDLTKCVTDFSGAIGYVDVDKLMSFEEIGDVAGAHVAKYNGADPVRRNIVNGVYEFWAAQHVYFLPSAFATGSGYDTILADMTAYSSDPANLNTHTLGNAAYFWAAQSEMNVERDTDGGVIY